jgi:hypothetical protein
MAKIERPGWVRRWGEALAAVLLGNMIYFAASPYLPESLQHEPFEIDAGLAVDFAICVLAYVAVRWIHAIWSGSEGS